MSQESDVSFPSDPGHMSTSTSPRRPLLSDGGVSGSLPSRPAVTGVPAYRPMNVKRSTHAQRLFALLLLIMVLLIAGVMLFAYSFYRSEIKPDLTLIRATALRSAGLPIQQEDDVNKAIEIVIPTALREEMASASSKVSELQKQFDSIRSQQAAQEQRLQKLAERLATSGSGAGSLGTADAAGVTTDAPTTSALEAGQSPTNAELLLLKERNRLTAYADEAISTGARRPLDRILEAMEDPERASLWHAGKAEYYRVMSHYQFVSRIDPAFKIDVAQVMPDAGLRDEADLKADQIIGLLANYELDWQTRLRAAFLLGGRRTPEVGAALVKAIKEDPNLDVAKEAQLSFEQNLDRRFLLFDIAAIDSWWQTQIALRSGPAPRAEIRAKEAAKQE